MTTQTSRRLFFAAMSALLACLSGIAMAGPTESRSVDQVANSPGLHPSIGETQVPPANNLFIDLYIRDNCDSCVQATEWLRHYEKQNRGVQVRVRDVSKDKNDLRSFWALSKKFKIEKPGLPAIRVCGQFKIGFIDAKTSGPAIEEMLTIHAFVREGCVHCRDGKAFLSRLKERWPGIRVQLHDIADSDNRERMYELGRRYGVQIQSVPCLQMCGRFLVGYQTDDTTGRQIEELLKNSNVLAEDRGHTSVPKRDESKFILASFHQHDASNDGRVESKTGTAHSADDRKSERLDGTGTHAADDEFLPLPDEASAAEETTAETGSEDRKPPEEVEVPLLGRVVVREWSLPAFTFLIGLIDGFNPCAMWVLILLLSLLVNIRDRKKIMAIAGTFVLVSGLAYYAFMAAWLNVFAMIGMVRAVQIVLGLLAIVIGVVNVKDFFAFKRGISLSIPQSMKPGLYSRMRGIVTERYLPAAVGAAIVLAVVVNVIELLCTAGLPAVYTEILTFQHLPRWQNYAFLALYIVAYMLDDTIMLCIAIVTLSRRRLQGNEGRWLKLVSGVVILALGMVILLKPDWLR